MKIYIQSSAVIVLNFTANNRRYLYASPVDADTPVFRGWTEQIPEETGVCRLLRLMQRAESLPAPKQLDFKETEAATVTYIGLMVQPIK